MHRTVPVHRFVLVVNVLLTSLILLINFSVVYSSRLAHRVRLVRNVFDQFHWERSHSETSVL